MKKIITLLLIALLATGACFAKKSASKKSNAPKLTALEKKVVGKHLLSLQWISWDYFGSATVTKQKDGTLTIKGEQLDRQNVGDYLKIDGTIVIESEDVLIFNGTIETKIYHINGGQPCIREGEQRFVKKPGKRYWRMQNITNPCDNCADYVDIYMKKK